MLASQAKLCSSGLHGLLNNRVAVDYVLF